MNNKTYYLSFSHFFGIGPIKLKQLVNAFGSVEKAYRADQKELSSVIGNRLSEKFIAFRNRFDPAKKMEELKKKNIKVLCWEDKNYPKSLKKISDPAICLYLKGDFDFTAHQYYFAVVGTRTPTGYGQQIARRLSSELAKAGFVIVSGMAHGVDAMAHQAALEVSAPTVAVLGCGVDICYPAANRNIYQQIIANKGAVISEFPPGQLVLKGLFISRNRIISGLSKGVLVVEGGKYSGALITARYAAEQGRDVFAPPAPITSTMSEAPNILLKQGAKLVTSIEDILEEFNLKIVPQKKENIFSTLTEPEKRVFNLLLENPQTADELSLVLQTSISKILYMLSFLEIKGVLKKDEQGKYQVKI